MSEWRVAPLREIADIRVSNVDKKSAPNEAPVRLCNYMDVYANDYIRADLPFMEATATAAEIQRFGVQQGDVMITKDSETPDDIGIPAVVMDQIEGLVCGYHLAQIRPNRALVDSVYLAQQLALHETAVYFATRAAGSTRYGLSNRTIADVPIRLAPLGQQRRIAEIIAGLDGAIERTEVLIKKHQQIKAGLMHDLFTRGLSTTGRIGPRGDGLPSGWRWVPLGDVARVVGGVTLGGAGPANGVVVPYLRVANVQDGYLALEEVKTIRVSRAILEELRLLPGDALMNEGGDFDKLGRGTVWSGEIDDCIHQNHVFRVRTDRSVLNPEYLAFHSESHYGKRYFLISSKQSTNLASINATQLRRYPIALPPSDEQARIVARLSAANAHLSGLERSVVKLRAQKLGLMQDLLTGKVRVPLREPEVTA
jgi:type I restriction enzyme, S subunit